MSFDRSQLPSAQDFFESQGLLLRGRGQWRTTSCVFHGGSDSMRINTHSGAYVCMSCGQSGGDVLAYHMEVTGAEFVMAAKALGAWVYDGKGESRRPTPLPPRAALEVMGQEATVVAVAAGNVAHGVALTKTDRERVMRAAGRINRIVGMFS